MDDSRKDSEAKPQQRTLNSWKEIADYLQVTARTAQLWEEKRNLPVHRIPGARGRVYALAEELDAWKQSGTQDAKSSWNGAGAGGERGLQTTPEAAPSGGKTKPLFILLLAAAAAVSVPVIYFLLTRSNPSRPEPPALWRMAGNALIVMDARERELWRKPFTEEIDSTLYGDSNQYRRNLVQFRDLDGDGSVEALLNLHFWRNGGEFGELVCLSEKGAEKWRFVPGKPVSSPKEHFSGAFAILNFAVADLGGQYPRSVIVASRQVPNYPCQVALISPQGGLYRQYWHSGHIGQPLCLQVADLNKDGQAEIYLGGVNNGSRCATLVVLDPRTMGGTSEEEDPDFQLAGFETGREVARVLFPRSCLAEQTARYNTIHQVAVGPSSLTLHVSEGPEQASPVVYYELDASYRPLSFGISDRFRLAHEQMSKARRLDHLWSEAEAAAMRDKVRGLRRPGS